MNQYIIPANSKKSQLIFGLFTKIDIWILATGVAITVILGLVLKNPSMLELVMAILPACTAACLVFPVPNYHNVLKLIENILNFYLNGRKYLWKGWCIKDGEK